MTIEFKAEEFTSAGEAIQYVNASGRGEAVRIHGRNMVVDQRTLDVLTERGVEFVYLIDEEMPDGTHRIMTIPVND